jgi:hypothetical protein
MRRAYSAAPSTLTGHATLDRPAASVLLGSGRRAHRKERPCPTSPTPAPTPIDQTDWANTTLPIPGNPTGCAAGTARFHNGTATVGGTSYRISPGYNQDVTPVVAYGDVDRDGQTDAMLVLECLTTLEVRPDGTVHYVARTFEGLSQCAADMHWAGSRFTGDCLP